MELGTNIIVDSIFFILLFSVATHNPLLLQDYINLLKSTFFSSSLLNKRGVVENFHMNVE